MWTLGRTVVALMGVAKPNLCQTSAPSAMSTIVTTQRLAAPTLLSHFSISSPRMLRMVASARPASDTMMKYAGDPDHEPELPP